MCKRIIILLLWSVLLPGSIAAQEPVFEVSSGPAFVISSGRSEVMGPVALVAAPSCGTDADGVCVSQAGAIDILYLGLPIENSSLTGVTVTENIGGVVTSSPAAGSLISGSVTVTNTSAGGRVSIALNGGVDLAAADSLTVTGVRGQIVFSSASAPESNLTAEISGSANIGTFTRDAVVVGRSAVGLEFVGLDAGPTPGTTPTLTFREGFFTAFVQHVATATTAAPPNARPAFGALNNTQLNIVLTDLPGRIVWPITAPSQLAGSAGVGGGGSELQLLFQDALGAQAIYEFATADQSLSDNSQEVFDITPTVCGLGTSSLQAQLFPAEGGRPEFADPLLPSPPAQFGTPEVCDPSPLVIVSGDDQIGNVQTELPQPLVVRALDDNGDPIAGVTVNFGGRSGGGSVAPEAVTTDAAGLAQTQATLGPEPGTHFFGATANTFTVLFRARAVASQVPPLPHTAAVPNVEFGEGAVTRIALLNQSGAENLSQVNFLNQAGVVVSTESHLLPPNSRVDITTGEPNRSGPRVTQWAVVGSEEPVGLNILFDRAGSAPDAPPTAESFSTLQPFEKLTVPFAFSGSDGEASALTTQLALANFSSNSNTIGLQLRDAGGGLRAQDSLTLPPFGQTAFGVSERAPFQAVLQGQLAFFGSLVITGNERVAALALGDDFGQLFANDVRRPRSCFLSPFSPPQTIVLPHLVVGGGWATEIIITNLCAAQNPLQFEVFDQAGNPVESFLGSHATLQPLATAAFSSSEEDRFGPITVRWARITANGATSAQVLLELKPTPAAGVVGAVGGLPTPPLRRFRLPIDLGAVAGEQGQAVAIGVAFANASDETNEISLQLVNTLGQVVAQDTSISLPPRGQAAVVLSTLPGFNSFLSAQPAFNGTLLVVATQPTAALGTGNFGPFFAIPPPAVPE